MHNNSTRNARVIPELATSVTDTVIIAFPCICLAILLLGGLVLAERLGGTDPAIIVATALLVALALGVWYVGMQFERAWLNNEEVSLLGDGLRRRPMIAGERLSLDARVGRASEFVSAGAARTPVR
jgi:hypothetical protein